MRCAGRILAGLRAVAMLADLASQAGVAERSAKRKVVGRNAGMVISLNAASVPDRPKNAVRKL